MIRLDHLPKHEDIKLYQDDEMFCINTDTMVLGEFLEVYKKDVVLEIGKSPVKCITLRFLVSENVLL